MQRDVKIDPDYKGLTRDGQWLYGALLLDVDFVGVADWSPKKIAKHAIETTALDVERAAAELRAKLFIVVDDETDEVLVRTFIKHDGLYKQPNMCVAMVKAFRKIGSPVIQGVIAHELHRIKQATIEEIDGAGLPPTKKKSEQDKADHCFTALTPIMQFTQVDPAGLLESFVETYDAEFDHERF
jgi:hypothetical protein